MKSATSAAPIPSRPFGKTGVNVCPIGLGGYHLGTISSKREAVALVKRAVDAGITFMDNAWEYHDGRSEELMGAALEGRRDQVFLMTKVCTHGRDAKTAMRQLEQSLRRLKTDYLDLWQIHEVVYDNDPELHFANGGVVEAIDRAKREGKTRFVGFTGHKDPAIHLRMLSYDYPFDSCQLPLNCFDGAFRSFETQVLPELVRRKIAPIGMKSLGGRGEAVKKRVVSAPDAIRYAMSLPIATLVSGIDSQAVLRQNLKVARGFTPMSDAEMHALRTRLRGVAGDGRFELYKTSMQHEGPIGRRQHGFPDEEAVAR
jgi:predicted aldo/keto reductase-like oxidoreductase